MRYRAKTDAIVTDGTGKQTLVAKGDKVFIEQAQILKWKVFSFYTRDLLAVLSQEELEEIFAPEEEFEKPQRRDKFKGRDFGRVLMITALLFSLRGVAQETDPVSWSVGSDKMTASMYKVTLSANIEPGWWIYHINTNNICVQTSRLKISLDSNGIQMDTFEIEEYGSSDFDKSCGAVRYYEELSITCPIWVKPGKSTLLRVTITYQPVTRYGAGESKVASFWVSLGEESRLKGEGKYIRPIPWRVGKMWWRVTHPFRKPFWKY